MITTKTRNIIVTLIASASFGVVTAAPAVSQADGSKASVHASAVPAFSAGAHFKQTMK